MLLADTADTSTEIKIKNKTNNRALESVEPTAEILNLKD